MLNFMMIGTTGFTVSVLICTGLSLVGSMIMASDFAKKFKVK